MRKVLLTVFAIGVGCLIGFSFGSNPWTVQGQGNSGSIAAVPGVVGGQDTFGPYDVAKDWPANISTVPGNEKWTWGAGQGIYAENPNRVFLLFRGELPNIKRPDTKLIPDFGASLIFPIGRLPWRDATVSALPGSCPVPPDPGRADTVASRQGRRPIGKIRLAPKSGINFVSGRLIFGSSPRNSRKTRLGFSA